MKASEAILKIVQSKPDGQQLRDITDRLAEIYDKTMEFSQVRHYIEKLIEQKLVQTKLVKGGSQRIYYPINSNDNPTDVGATQLPSTKAPTSTSVGDISEGTLLGYRATGRSLSQPSRLAPVMDRNDGKLVALLVDDGESDPIEDRCCRCFKIKWIKYCLDKSHQWLCRPCAENAPSIVTLSPLQSKIYLSFKRHHYNYFFSRDIAEELGVKCSSVRQTLIRLKHKGILQSFKGKNRTHSHEVLSATGETVKLTSTQWQVYQAVMTEECQRTIFNVMPKVAEISGVNFHTCGNVVRKLRNQGIHIADRTERHQNLVHYLKRRIWTEGLTNDDLKSKEFCQSVGVAFDTMEQLLAEIRRDGVKIPKNNLARTVSLILPSGTFSQSYIFNKLEHPQSSIKYALDSLVKDGVIHCLNPEDKPSDRLYQPAKEAIAS